MVAIEGSNKRKGERDLIVVDLAYILSDDEREVCVYGVCMDLSAMDAEVENGCMDGSMR